MFDAGGSGGGDQEPVRQFKQSKLDAMSGERAKQARNSVVIDLLKDLGMESQPIKNPLIGDSRVSAERLELSTNGLKGHCSAIELRARRERL